MLFFGRLISRPEWPIPSWSWKHKLYSGTVAFLQFVSRPILRLGPIERALDRYGDKGEKVWVNDYPQGGCARPIPTRLSSLSLGYASRRRFFLPP